MWNDLTAAALLGSGRGLAPVVLPGRLNELLAGVATDDRLLRAAGILALAEQAGLTVSPTAEPPPPPAPPDPAASTVEPELTALLTRWIESGPPPLLIEAFQLLAETQRCLPPRLLPPALELGCKSIPLREPLRRVVGQRGAWLAAQNPEWNFAALAGIAPEQRRLWDEGDPEQRAAFLRRWRAIDPAEARSLLEEVFSSELARVRAVLLPALAEQLGPDDEPFLAITLTQDRSREVRQTAAALLSRLPGSAFAGRMIARLDACIHNQRRLLHTVAAVEPPAAFAPDWQTDTLEEPPPAAVKLGERAWWLQQIVSYTPLPWWEERLHLAPAAVLDWAGKSEWKKALLAGLRAALDHQPHYPAWTLAMLERGGFPHQQAVELAQTLAPVEADAVLQRIFAATDDAALAAQRIETAAFTWSLPLWQVVRQQPPIWLAQSSGRFQTCLPVLACRIPPAALAGAISGPELEPFAQVLAGVTAIIEQRQALHRQFHRSSPLLPDRNSYEPGSSPTR